MDEPPAEIDVELAAHDAPTGGCETAMEFAQLTVFDEPVEVIVTDAVLVPIVVYFLEADLPLPERPSVPLHEYV